MMPEASLASPLTTLYDRGGGRGEGGGGRGEGGEAEGGGGGGRGKGGEGGEGGGGRRGEEVQLLYLPTECL